MTLDAFSTSKWSRCTCDDVSSGPGKHRRLVDSDCPLHGDYAHNIPNLKAKTANAYDANCKGCLATGSDVMLSFGQPTPYDSNNSPMGPEEDIRVVDVFLSRAAAENLYDRLGYVLAKL